MQELLGTQSMRSDGTPVINGWGDSGSAKRGELELRGSPFRPGPFGERPFTEEEDVAAVPSPQWGG